MVCACNAKSLAQDFYDSKANIAGVSGNYLPLIEGGYEGRFFNNDVPVDDPKLMTADGKKYNLQAMAQRLNQQQVGKRILDYLFMRDANGKLSEQRLKERAIKNIQLNDFERAQVGLIDATTIMQEDYIGILLNNFIVLTQKNNRYTKWAVFHVDITKSTLDDVFAAWDDPSRYEKIRVNVSPVATGRSKERKASFLRLLLGAYMLSPRIIWEHANNTLRDIGEKVPELAIRGQIYQNNPLTADVGNNMGIKNADRLYVYRQYSDKNGRLHSKKIAEARAADVEDSTLVVRTYSGMHPSYKKGDIVRLHADEHIRNHFTYGTNGSLNNLSYTFDYLASITRSGIGRHLLFTAGYSYFKDGRKSLFQWSDGNLVNAPKIYKVGLGQGVSFVLFDNLELMPYVTLNYEILKFDNHIPAGTLGLSTDYLENEFTFTLGAKAIVKIAGPLHVVGGVGYNGNLGRPKGSGSNFAKYDDLKEYIFDPAGWNRYGLDVYGGLIFAF